MFVSLYRTEYRARPGCSMQTVCRQVYKTSGESIDNLESVAIDCQHKSPRTGVFYSSSIYEQRGVMKSFRNSFFSAALCCLLIFSITVNAAVLVDDMFADANSQNQALPS